MMIPRENLIAWNPTRDLINLFDQRFPSGLANYQDLLRFMEDLNLAQEALWLMGKMGQGFEPISEYLELSLNRSFYHVGSLRVQNDCQIKRDLFVTGNVHAFSDLIVSGDIRILGSLTCGSSIFCSGDLVVDGAIFCRQDLTVKRSICSRNDGIKVGGALKSEGTVRTTSLLHIGENLETLGAVVSKGPIKVGKNLIAGSVVKSRFDIKVGGDLLSGHSITSKGAISAGGDIKNEGILKANKNITSGGDITVEYYIQAGRSIIAQKEISAGPTRGIFAGLHCQVSEIGTEDLIVSETQPASIRCGTWKKYADVHSFIEKGTLEADDTVVVSYPQKTMEKKS